MQHNQFDILKEGLLSAGNVQEYGKLFVCIDGLCGATLKMLIMNALEAHENQNKTQ